MAGEDKLFSLDEIMDDMDDGGGSGGKRDARPQDSNADMLSFLRAYAVFGIVIGTIMLLMTLFGAIFGR
jgi:hypothetical protein